eukprot:TRINITY_DN4976_c0_g2_i1.p1 TRINITY_DN4976_c0_g2~~TRINITY_DN4976_c0_g2_i1.p1  ORF type:complete len:178 (-),score=24.04 TRINITY_DN4976_c0_g2_i1:2-472(-)
MGFSESVITRAVDKAFHEVAEIDRTPGYDGRQVINTTELYAGVLLVYNYVNKLSPGSHLDPPKKDKVFSMLKEFDYNSDGVLDRFEFEQFVHKFSKHLARRVVVNSIVVCSVVPALVFLTKASLKEFDSTKKIGKHLPGSVLACVFTTAFKLLGAF